MRIDMLAVSRESPYPLPSFWREEYNGEKRFIGYFPIELQITKEHELLDSTSKPMNPALRSDNGCSCCCHS
jgi:hypothetical protein